MVTDLIKATPEEDVLRRDIFDRPPILTYVFANMHSAYFNPLPFLVLWPIRSLNTEYDTFATLSETTALGAQAASISTLQS